MFKAREFLNNYTINFLSRKMSLLFRLEKTILFLFFKISKQNKSNNKNREEKNCNELFALKTNK